MSTNVESAWRSGVPEIPGSGLILRGIAAVLFGLLLLIWPGISLIVLFTLFGIFAFVDGIVAIVSAVATPEGRKRWWALLIAGLAGIAAGIVTFSYPGKTLVVMLYIIAIWAIVTGIFHVIAAIMGHNVVISNRWLWALSGALSILFGILLMTYPVVGIAAVVWLIGFYSLIFGFTEIVLGIELRSFTRGFRAAMQH